MAAFPQNEKEFDKWLVKEYFKYGSVDEVFRRCDHLIPVSYATYQRVLEKFGVIKAAGPNNKLTEAVEFLSHIASDNLSIEELHKKIPSRLQTSAVTLYRILEYIKEGLTRRVGVGLIITPYDAKEKILLAKDISTPRIELGKTFGSLTIPMGYARKRDSRKVNILRILQQEVFTEKVVKGNFPLSLLDINLEPYMYLDIADVRVAIFHLQLPKGLSLLSNFSSFKLKEHCFFEIGEILNKKKAFRVGVKEAVRGYKKHLELLERNLVANPLQVQSILNKELATLEIEIED